ncbi:ABC transporter permease [Fictibacillus macauensis ZFHKF-1]|uniref:ABC transporter permease n=1 Tax=Fictibacillus macauensis ZFHKF-1 TaxID=1196324 RepID=I8AGN1_9BACL|nr:ABC transporter permease [Fictibacillus macauensis]EIT84837.1 ABC transporter permease [Fictibacillus macauensis ZFHKF-1]
MSIKTLILRSLKKNLTNYYLYVFALVFSSALYFSFVTLRYDSSMNKVQASVKGEAGFSAASILLLVIVSVFLLYANQLFMKRRSKEIGLYQLVGMTKFKVFRLLSIESMLIYFGSLTIGVILGFFSSRLIVMLLFKITNVQAVATLHFSPEALLQTLLVFLVIFVLMLLVNYFFMKRQSILSLFRVVSTTEASVKKQSVLELIIGIAGLCLIILGYYLSSRLFSTDTVATNALLGMMVAILASVIIGTYFFYKGSISFLFNLIRKKKNGFLSVQSVLSLSTLMFRMKANSFLLTVITTISALAIGLLSLSYISYYSAEKASEQFVPNDFTFSHKKDLASYEKTLSDHGIPFEEHRIKVLSVPADLSDVSDRPLIFASSNSKYTPISVISTKSINEPPLKKNEMYLTGANDSFLRLTNFKESGTITFKLKKESLKRTFTELKHHYVVSIKYSNGSLPVAVVDHATFQLLEKEGKPTQSIYNGLDIKDNTKLEAANDYFIHQFKPVASNNLSPRVASRIEDVKQQRGMIGLAMFIVGFLGLTFLITSGCILYFKQMGESEEEQPNYTVLRKLGFTRDDLLKGIMFKQLFNFGIPLFLGLSHSYFAVKSGWFFFGVSLWTPTLIVMGIYTMLYSIFAILSTLYYKKIINDSL